MFGFGDGQFHIFDTRVQRTIQAFQVVVCHMNIHGSLLVLFMCGRTPTNGRLVKLKWILPLDCLQHLEYLNSHCGGIRTEASSLGTLPFCSFDHLHPFDVLAPQSVATTIRVRRISPQTFYSRLLASSSLTLQPLSFATRTLPSQEKKKSKLIPSLSK